MLCHDRIDISERIGLNKTSESKECNICCYWYFLNEGFKSQSYACKGFHDLLMISINLDHISILNIKSVDYRCNIN